MKSDWAWYEFLEIAAIISGGIAISVLAAKRIQKWWEAQRGSGPRVDTELQPPTEDFWTAIPSPALFASA